MRREQSISHVENIKRVVYMCDLVFSFQNTRTRWIQPCLRRRRHGYATVRLSAFRQVVLVTNRHLRAAPTKVFFAKDINDITCIQF